MILNILQDSKIKNQENEDVEINLNKMMEKMMDDFTIDYTFKYKWKSGDEKEYIIQIPYKSSDNFENGYQHHDLQLGKLSLIGIYRGEVNFSQRESINICYEIDDIEKKLVEKQIEFIDISSLVQILELRKDIVLQAEMLFLRISTIYRGKFCIKRDYISLLEEKFPYMFLEKILFGKSSETKNEVNIEKKLDASEILRIAEDINNSLKGHDEFKKDFKRDLLKFAFLNNMGERKIFSIIICGQSGIGKTEFAKIVSDKMFPNEELIKINFGNYSTEGVLNSLIGSPLGYVGSEEGGELINKIQKSKSKVILIDEFEKATASVYNFFYELLEDGVFTDRHGIKHDLDGYIIIFTSNMSQETYQKKIPDSLKSRFDMVYYFINVPGQEKQLFIQNSALELIEKLQIHFGKKVSYESITDELEKLIAYDNLRDIKRKVQDIVFCEFFKIR